MNYKDETAAVRVNSSVRELADTVTSEYKTLENIKIFLLLLEAYLPKFLVSHEQSPSKTKKAVTLESLLAYMNTKGNEKIRDEFKEIDYRNLLTTIKRYHDNNPPKNVKKFVAKFIEFMSNPDVRMLASLKAALESAQTPSPKSTLQRRPHVADLPSIAVSTTHIDTTIIDTIFPVAPEDVTLASDAMPDEKETLISANDQTKNYTTFSKPAGPYADSTKSTSPNDTEPNTVEVNQPSLLSKLTNLIQEIEKIIAQFEKGSHQLFSVGMGKKAAGIRAALEKAKVLIENNPNNHKLDYRALCMSFLNVKDKNLSLYEALNKHRLSPTRKNGNSLFFNSPSDSLKRIVKFVEESRGQENSRPYQR